MKQIQILMLLSLIAIAQFHADAQNYLKSKETKNLNFNFEEDFNSIMVYQGIEVEIVKGNENKAEVTTNFPEYFQMEVQGGKLTLRYDVPNHGNLRKAESKVTLTAKQIDEFRAASAGSITVLDQFDTPEITIDATSASCISYDFTGEKVWLHVSAASCFEGELNVEKLDIELTSASTLSLSGAAEKVDLDVSSTANADLSKMDCAEAWVNCTSIANAKIHVTKSLDAHATSMGEIVYTTSNNAEVNTSCSSEGTIRKR